MLLRWKLFRLLISLLPLFLLLQKRCETLLKEKEELSKENQALSRQLEEVKQGS